MAVAPKAQGGRRRPHLSVPIAVIAVMAGLALGGQAPAVAGALTGAPDSPVGRLALAAGNPLTSTAYSFVSDSGGGHANPGAEVDLLFATDNEAYLYFSDPTEALGEDGSYSYTDGRLSLRISTPDFKANATFPLSLSASRVTMPFQVFSAKAGTSVWQSQPLDLVQGTFAVYNAAMNAGTLNLTPAEGAERAYAYAEAWLTSNSSTALSVHGKLFGSLSAKPSLSGQCAAEGGNCIVGVQNLGDDIEVSFKDSPPILISLYSSAGGAPATPLTDSPLASDPRVYLNPTIHPDKQFDPPNRKAVIIDPRTELESKGALENMVSTLENRHYGVTELDGKAATIERIVSALKEEPGFVVFSTHGNTQGQLVTGDLVPVSGTKDQPNIKGAYRQFNAELRGEGLASLVSYKLPDKTPACYLGAPNCSFKILQWDDTCDWEVVVTPAFWKWLTTQGVSFAHSLVFISACETDETPVLRSQIRARSYFAFSKDVESKFATAVEQYLVQDLARPTHSPEEAYYNMVRIEKTRQMIYKEDHLFDGVLGPFAGDSSFDILDGWGWNGSALVEYQGSGWLGFKVDPGEVWWMLFAGRWDNNSSNGAEKLQECYNEYWSKGSPGGLADQYCNAANAGIPKDRSRLSNDVAYAIYLLTGKPPTGVSAARLPPRWTMAD